jgi:hypothetical protein
MSKSSDGSEDAVLKDLSRFNENGGYSSQTDFIEKKLRFLIHDYKTKRDENRDDAAQTRKIAIVLGSLVTLLLAVKQISQFKDFEEWFSLVALALSTVLTGLAAWESFTDYRWKWIRYRTTLSNLYSLRDEMHFAKAGNAGQLTNEDVQKFHKLLQETIHESNEEWMKQRGTAIRPK